MIDSTSDLPLGEVHPGQKRLWPIADAHGQPGYAPFPCGISRKHVILHQPSTGPEKGGLRHAPRFPSTQ